MKQNVKLEAFKQAIEKSKSTRSQEYMERSSMSQMLSENLEGLTEDQKEAARKSYAQQQDAYLRESRTQVTIADFDFVKVIGTGAFGIVRLCRKKDTGQIFAIKQMSKTEMVYKKQVNHVRAEKDALSIAKNDWVIGLNYTFQDDSFLYMVMDYLPGGDLMTHLMRKDTFTEHETRFYIAELVEAVDYIHTNLHYIHRDIKPDNIVFDAEGHIHLLDFGLCKHNPPQPAAKGPLERMGAVDRSNPDSRQGRRQGWHLPRAALQSVVGTPDYMGPEVYNKEPAGKECDWWSVGIIMFEMLFGGPPFSDERHDPAVTSARIVRWRQHFHMPPDPGVSENARDLIRGLICDRQDRLTADGIRVHPFFGRLFQGKPLRECEPPIKPVVNGPLDTSNFDDFSGAEAKCGVKPTAHQASKDPSLWAFHDYGYRRDLELKKPSVSVALQSAVQHDEAAGGVGGNDALTDAASQGATAAATTDTGSGAPPLQRPSGAIAETTTTDLVGAPNVTTIDTGAHLSTVLQRVPMTA